MIDQIKQAAIDGGDGHYHVIRLGAYDFQEMEKRMPARSINRLDSLKNAGYDNIAWGGLRIVFVKAP